VYGRAPARGPTGIEIRGAERDLMPNRSKLSEARKGV
jgi:hypothetical protein